LYFILEGRIKNWIRRSNFKNERDFGKGPIMGEIKTKSEMDRKIQDFIKSSFKQNCGKLKRSFGTNPVWARLRELGSELWLDTGADHEQHTA
jgi:hypothetical protein